MPPKPGRNGSGSVCSCGNSCGNPAISSNAVRSRLFLDAWVSNLAIPVYPAERFMKIGVPKEIKIHEYRVGLVPAGVRELVDSGHQVLVQSGAGAGIGFEDSHYQAAGATISRKAEDIFASADLVVKVKEPQLDECKLLRSGQILFTYLHLAADRE